ncbi:hypothetical protein ACJJTC_018994 [Scirpophaga incertulas]
MEQAGEMIMANRRVTVYEITSYLNISHGSAYTIIDDQLDFHKVDFHETQRSAALTKMPLGLYNELKATVPFLANQSEDCLFLNIYVPGSGMNMSHNIELAGPKAKFSFWSLAVGNSLHEPRDSTQERLMKSHRAEIFNVSLADLPTSQSYISVGKVHRELGTYDSKSFFIKQQNN